MTNGKEKEILILLLISEFKIEEKIKKKITL